MKQMSIVFQRPNIFLRTFLKTEFKYFNEFPDIYDVQIFTMICINERSVDVGRERKAYANKKNWSVSTKTRTYVSIG